ncbi:vitellin-degrading protease isoform X2 [Polyergus mexicanus]|uniref:vitellin-degrading protease isoform X2 n=1 Tax=Polyergus mexicanus TaxID=615972 RepID=UPI0038B583C2
MNARFLMLISFLYFTHSQCKLSSNSVERIIGGEDINIKAVPYVLSMILDGAYACNAAIINNNWAVTAAHCITAVNDPLKEITVCSGSSILYKNCVAHNIVNFFIHENYNSMINDYDIAVIKVTPFFTYNSFTKAVDLAPDNAKNVFTESGIVCGWGYYLKFDDDSIDPILPKTLKCIVIPLIERESCCEDYKDRYVITPRMSCYGYQDGAKDACKGDSGAALVNKNGILLGVTSWGDGCAEKYSPGVYTDAIYLRHWIKNKTEMDILDSYYQDIDSVEPDVF